MSLLLILIGCALLIFAVSATVHRISQCKLSFDDYRSMCPALASYVQHTYGSPYSVTVEKHIPYVGKILSTETRRHTNSSYHFSANSKKYKADAVSCSVFDDRLSPKLQPLKGVFEEIKKDNYVVLYKPKNPSRGILILASKTIVDPFRLSYPVQDAVFWVQNDLRWSLAFLVGGVLLLLWGLGVVPFWLISITLVVFVVALLFVIYVLVIVKRSMRQIVEDKRRELKAKLQNPNISFENFPYPL